MKTSTNLLLASLMTASLAGAAAADSKPVPYNRKAVAISKVANDDGTTTLHAFVQTQVPEQPATALDLSMLVAFQVNDVEVASSALAQFAINGNSCSVADYEECGETTMGPSGCAPLDPASTEGVCTTTGLASVIVPSSVIQPGDVLTAHITPLPGALVEIDTSDDSTYDGDGLVDGDDFLIWRSTTSATAVPVDAPVGGSASPADSFFDIWVEVDLHSDTQTPVDMSLTAEVVVNGYVLGRCWIKSWSTSGDADGVIPDVPIGPGDLVEIKLVPAPGTLPELPGFEDPGTIVTVPTLTADIDVLSVTAGGVQNMVLEGTPSHAGELYLILGSMSGTAPGTPAGAYNLPLNVDPYFLFTLNNPNSAVLVDTFGTLNAVGEGKASFVLPFASNPALSGTTLHHAGVLLHPVTLQPTATTNAVDLQLL